MKTVLVSLVSEQTLPNVQLIKEFKSDEMDFIFISTNSMNDKGCKTWIENAAKIKSTHTFDVNEFSYDDILKQLNDYDFSSYEKILVNLTGGTKVMTLAAHDYFKEEGADIFYVTGTDKKFIKIYPGKRKQELQINTKISISEYLTAYGFSFEISEQILPDADQLQQLYNSFISGHFENNIEALTILRKFRSKKKGIKTSDWNEQIAGFVLQIGYIPKSPDQLTDEEVKLLTGDWFELYIYLKVKADLNLDDDQIVTGIKFQKTVKDKEIVQIQELLETAVIETLKPDNEIDVMFMYRGKLYIIECKTSIIDMREIEQTTTDGIVIKMKETNILGETIYKADSIKTKFGLFANSYIFTLTNFKEYITRGTPVEVNNKNRSMQELISRATLSNIRLVDFNRLNNSKSIFNIL